MARDRTRPRILACFLGASWILATGPMTAGAAGKEVSFHNQVMAVLSKAGCNSGACHGNANGKGGFKLSLRGEDPLADHAAIVREAMGRRVDWVDPAASLLLLKPTTRVGHEGGQRLKAGSKPYGLLEAWIGSGAGLTNGPARRLRQLDVTPSEVYLEAPSTEFAIRATARFDDGTTEDVTDLAVYESSTPSARISEEGRVERLASGEATILVRYLHLQHPVRVAFVQENPAFTWRGPPKQHWIDDPIFAKLERLKIQPSRLANDSEFCRRVTLDLIGVLPSAAEAKAFVADTRRDKRARYVDALLQRPEFADHWALKWADLLRAEERLLDRKGIDLLQRWLREAFRTNMPLDRFAREIVGARGSTYLNPAANFYRAIRTPEARAEAVAQVFLGTRLNCAQCHNHPFDRWTQQDYYDWSGVFARVQYKVMENRRRDSNDQHEFKGEQIVFVASKGEVRHPKTGRPVRPRLLGEEAARVSDRTPATAPGLGTLEPDPLESLAAWVASRSNPFFARAQVNRIWYHLLGRGLVDPIDDFRATNPPSHPELLQRLAEEFVRSGYDMRAVVRWITSSTTYQLASEPNAENRDDESNFSRAVVRRLTAEQLLDCQSQVTGSPLDFSGYPQGMRAVQLPGGLPERRRNDKKSGFDQFLETFGKPARLLTCECERSGETTMGQAFQMISGPATHALLTARGNRLESLAASDLPTRAGVEELFWTALTRPPAGEELIRAVEAVDSAKGGRRVGYEDLAWALMNAKEFVLRR